MTGTTPALLSIRNIEVRFGGLLAIADLHFEVFEGELVSLIGPNGAGKTTAFNVITGFLKPTSGHVVFREKSLSGLKPHQVAARGLVRTFQRTSVFANNTVLENIRIGLHREVRSSLFDVLLAGPRQRANEKEINEKAFDILRLLGIERRANEYAGGLPYGDQRLLGVGLALAANPAMLLLDEPVSGMNPSETSTFIRMLSRIRKRGITVLLVEHDMPMVMNVSDRIVVLNYGRIIAQGVPDDIQNNPDVISAYLGQGARSA